MYPHRGAEADIAMHMCLLSVSQSFSHLTILIFRQTIAQIKTCLQEEGERAREGSRWFQRHPFVNRASENASILLQFVIYAPL